MPRLFIDQRKVEVPAGATILDAARKLGLDIPTLCFRDGHKPLASCRICLVKVKGVDRLASSCATLAEEGMQVESETEELRRIRRTGLELLLGDHAGDCLAPCQRACPVHMDIPLMLRQIAAGQFAEALATIKRDMALPAVLGRVCTKPCERACRRRQVDAPAAICLLKTFVADRDLAFETPHQPPCKPDNGKTVAIVGAGPTGLTAAYHLLQQGYACTLLDQRPEPGGRLRYEIAEAKLPRTVLDAEIAVIERMGARFDPGTAVGVQPSLADLGSRFDAVLVAAGKLDQARAERLGVPAEKGRVQADTTTHQTALPGVFVAGGALRPGNLVVRSMADGRAAAACIDRYLSGRAVIGPSVSFEFRSGRLTAEEIGQLAAGADPRERVVPCGPLTEEQARGEALRCLHCDCGKQADCKLRHYAQTYGAKAARYRGDRRTFERHLQHAEATYEPGKCIRCGLCVQIATDAGEPLGLTFIGRGFDLRVGVPFNHSIAEGLQHTARQCVQACPTGALASSFGSGFRGKP